MFCCCSGFEDNSDWILRSFHVSVWQWCVPRVFISECLLFSFLVFLLCIFGRESPGVDDTLLLIQIISIAMHCLPFLLCGIGTQYRVCSSLGGVKYSFLFFLLDIPFWGAEVRVNCTAKHQCLLRVSLIWKFEQSQHTFLEFCCVKSTCQQCICLLNMQLCSTFPPMSVGA